MHHFTTMAVIGIFKHAASFSSPFERFQMIDHTGVFEISLRSTYHTSKEIEDLLQLYDGRDVIRFKNKGLWRAPPGDLVRARLSHAIGVHVDQEQITSQQQDILQSARELLEEKTAMTLLP